MILRDGTYRCDECGQPHPHPLPASWMNAPLTGGGSFWQYCSDCQGDGRALGPHEFAAGLQAAKEATQSAALSFIDNPTGVFSVAYHAMIRVLRNYGVRDSLRESVPPPDHSTDPRLAHLPDDLRAVAVEFLDLHGAWDTEFEANVWTGDSLELIWDLDRQGRHLARVEWDPETVWRCGQYWSLLGRVLGADDRNELERVQACWYGPLRRSADFAEFVQRFRGVVPSETEEKVLRFLREIHAPFAPPHPADWRRLRQVAAETLPTVICSDGHQKMPHGNERIYRTLQGGFASIWSNWDKVDMPPLGGGGVDRTTLMGVTAVFIAILADLHEAEFQQANGGSGDE